MMSHRVVSEDGLKSLANGCSIDIRIPWYRSLPVSVFEVVEVSIDNQTIPLANVQFSLEGELIPPDELGQHTEETWHVVDSAFLVVSGISVARGTLHDVAVTLALFPPYIDNYKRITRTEKRLMAR